jgi:hypothetical protein
MRKINIIRGQVGSNAFGNRWIIPPRSPIATAQYPRIAQQFSTARVYAQPRMPQYLKPHYIVCQTDMVGVED